MAMGSREQRQRQEELWVATAALARPASHPFYDRLNRLLDECQFDEFVESLSKPFYAKTLGRPGLTPGIYFRLLMVGYFEGIDSERGMAWRAAVRWASAHSYGSLWTRWHPTIRPSRGLGD